MFQLQIKKGEKMTKEKTNKYEQTTINLKKQLGVLNDKEDKLKNELEMLEENTSDNSFFDSDESIFQKENEINEIKDQIEEIQDKINKKGDIK